MTPGFTGKTILITGAGGGLGLAMAQRLASEGAELILSDVNGERLQASAQTLLEQQVCCRTVVADLAQESGIAALADSVCADAAPLHGLINNAGLAYGEVAHRFTGLGLAKWQHFLTVNSLAPLLLAEALRPALARARGAIVNISSMASYAPATAYGVSKATLNALNYGMANAFAADGIRVNAIAPGIMATPASKGSLPAETYARVQAQQLLPLHGEASDIAALAAFLLSEEARFITNELISCDAGNRLRGWRL